MLLSGGHALCCCPYEKVTKGKDKKLLLFVLYCTASPFLSKIQQVSWGHEKNQFPHCWSTYRQYRKQNSSGNQCASNLASLTICIWKPGYFHKRHNPQSKQLKLLEGNRPNQKFAVSKKEKNHKCILLMNYLKPSKIRFSLLLPNQGPQYLSDV